MDSIGFVIVVVIVIVAIVGGWFIIGQPTASKGANDETGDDFVNWQKIGGDNIGLYLWVDKNNDVLCYLAIDRDPASFSLSCFPR